VNAVDGHEAAGSPEVLLEHFGEVVVPARGDQELDSSVLSALSVVPCSRAARAELPYDAGRDEATAPHPDQC